jgi:hypothetical protein
MDAIYCIIHTRLQTEVTDAMDIIYLVLTEVNNPEYVLQDLISDTCELELPMNIKLPIKVVLETYGLLNGIKRYINRT